MWVSRDGIRGYIDLEGKALCFHIWPESSAYKEQNQIFVRLFANDNSLVLTKYLGIIIVTLACTRSNYTGKMKGNNNNWMKKYAQP